MPKSPQLPKVTIIGYAVAAPRPNTHPNSSILVFVSIRRRRAPQSELQSNSLHSGSTDIAHHVVATFRQSGQQQQQSPNQAATINAVLPPQCWDVWPLIGVRRTKRDTPVRHLNTNLNNILRQQRNNHERTSGNAAACHTARQRGPQSIDPDQREEH